MLINELQLFIINYNLPLNKLLNTVITEDCVIFNVLFSVNLKNIRYKFDYSLYKGKNGKEYLNVTNSVMTFDIGRAYFTFENLFNGDKVLSKYEVFLLYLVDRIKVTIFVTLVFSLTKITSKFCTIRRRCGCLTKQLLSKLNIDTILLYKYRFSLTYLQINCPN